MDNNDLLVEALIETYLSKKPAFVFEQVTNDYESYIIEVYTSTNSKDKKYIAENKRSIKKFMDDGYEYAGIGKFMGCYNEDSVKRNTAMLKIARDKLTGNIIAMTIYSAKWGGLKCVGGTVIVSKNPAIRALGIEALKHITREDTKLWGDFIWTECSGAAQYLWENAGGIKIPSAYLSLFMDERTLASVEFKDDDPYTYSRIISRGTVDETRVDKVIFGFPNKDVLDKYIQDKNTTLEELCKEYDINPEDIINEGFRYWSAPKKIWPELKLIRYYHQEFMRGRMDVTIEEQKVLTSAFNKIADTMRTTWDRSPYKVDGLYKMMSYCVSIFNNCITMRTYKFGELLVPEKQKVSPGIIGPCVIV